MHFDTAPGSVFRPPSEAESFILRVTIGCSHNRCTYCNMYRDVQFRVRPLEEILRQINQARPYRDYVKRVFLADGDALVLATPKLLEILQILQAEFPKLRRVSSYAGPKDILRKTPEELRLLQAAGLKLVYYGLESGDDAVLSHVCKGVNAEESRAAGRRVTDSGIKLSLMVILGLGGKKLSRQHALNTATAINVIRPNMLSALTLMMYRGSELREEYERGEFELLSPTEIMAELYEMMAAIELPEGSNCIFRSNHISNYVNFAGTLPKDQARLLREIQQAEKQLARMKNWDPYNNVEY